jgi:hypothetical protein
MRKEFLADLELYLQLQRMVEEKRGGPISHQHSEKAARITNIVAQLSVCGQTCTQMLCCAFRALDRALYPTLSSVSIS